MMSPNDLLIMKRHMCTIKENVDISFQWRKIEIQNLGSFQNHYSERSRPSNKSYQGLTRPFVK